MAKQWYNESRKERFINEVNATASAKTLFSASSKFESEAGVDLGGIPPAQVQRFLNEELGSRQSSLQSMLSWYRSYQNWCANRGLESPQNTSEIIVDSSIAKRKTMVESPFHLEEVLNRAFSPVGDNEVDVLYRCYLWMAYAGLEDDDACEVLSKNVDLDEMCIVYEDKEYPLYRHSYQAMWNAKFLGWMKYVNVNYNNSHSILDRKQSEYLLRSVKTEKPTPKTLAARIRRVFREKGIELTYGSVKLSGEFYRLLRDERIGIAVNFDRMIADAAQKRGVDLSSQKGITLRRNMMRTLPEDYKAWKRAFE